MSLRTLSYSMYILLTLECLHAQEIAVPVNVQYPLFLRILTFDRKLKARVGSQIVIGILYQARFKASSTVKDELLKVIDDSGTKSVDDIPITVCLLDFRDDLDLEANMAKYGIDILYLAPLRAASVANIVRLSRAKKVTTLTGVPHYVDSGVAVGIGIKGQNPQIMVNLPAAKAEGMDLSSRLLKLAKVLKEGEKDDQ